MTVSVLLAVHNGERWLAKALESVRAQTLQDWELIIVLNGCSDNSEEIATAEALQDNRIRLVVVKDKGKNNAYNIAYQQSLGDYLCFFACDDVLSADSLEKRQAPIVAKGPDVFTTCRLQLISNDPRYDGVVMPRRPEQSNFSGGCLMFSRSLAEKIFPLPTCYPNEDTWVQLHLRLFGTVFHLPEVLYLYRIHEKNSFGYKISFEEKRARFLLRMKCYADVYERYRGQSAGASFVHDVLEPYVNGVQRCEQRQLLRIFFVSRLAWSQKFVLAGYCNAGVFWLRTVFGRFLTGRIRQG
jgi:glycosyltransferase involved in cell wall biosynthesis